MLDPDARQRRDFDLLHPGVARVRITNPLASDESVLRATMITGLVRVWGKNLERGTGDVVLAEIGNVFTHPDVATTPRMTRGGVGGSVTLALPEENERLTVVLGRDGDDATTRRRALDHVGRATGARRRRRAHERDATTGIPPDARRPARRPHVGCGTRLRG